MNTRVLAAAAVAIMVTACGGGGGGGGGPNTSASDIRSDTGLGPPTETPAAQDVRSPAIVARSDSLILSTLYGETSNSSLPTFRVRARCSGTSCSIFEPTTGYSDTIRLSDFESANLPTEAIGTKHGITLQSSSGRYAGTDLTAFGAWMDHSGFAFQTERFTVEGVRISGRYGLAGGDLTGSTPRGNATWQGLMVGTPATGSGRGDRLLGDAVLSYRLNASLIDARFSSIRNIDRRQAHSTSTVQFDSVPVSSRGTFSAGLTGNRIQGGFYGPAQTEATGVFEQNNIVGAFGAKRQ